MNLVHVTGLSLYKAYLKLYWHIAKAETHHFQEQRPLFREESVTVCTKYPLP